MFLLQQTAGLEGNKVELADEFSSDEEDDDDEKSESPPKKNQEAPDGLPEITTLKYQARSQSQR